MRTLTIKRLSPDLRAIYDDATAELKCSGCFNPFFYEDDLATRKRALRELMHMIRTPGADVDQVRAAYDALVVEPRRRAREAMEKLEDLLASLPQA